MPTNARESVHERSQPALLARVPGRIGSGAAPGPARLPLRMPSCSNPLDRAARDDRMGDLISPKTERRLGDLIKYLFRENQRKPCVCVCGFSTVACMRCDVFYLCI